MWQQLLSAAVVVATIVIALLLAWNTSAHGRPLDAGWAGLIGLVFGAVLGVPKVIERIQEQRRGAPAGVVDTPPSVPAAPSGEEAAGEPQI